MNTVTVMLADKSAIYSLVEAGCARQTGATYELSLEFAAQLAEGAAKKLGGRVVRVWHDHGAGGVFAELVLEGSAQ